MTNKEELKPCPQCQSEAWHREWQGAWSKPAYRVFCSNKDCPIHAKTDFYPTLKEATEVWNTRPSEPAEGEEKLRDRLKKLLGIYKEQIKYRNIPEAEYTHKKILQLFRTRGEGNG